MPETFFHSPLESLHVELGAKLVAFGGWLMPVQYTSIMDEHAAVRTSSGVFDISHMGQVLIQGSGAEKYLNHLLTNDCASLADGQGQYSLMLNENAGVIDDLIVYRESAACFFLVINASMIAEDVAWMMSQRSAFADVEVINQSDIYAGLAVQGPDAAAVFAAVFPDAVLPPRNGIERITRNGQDLVICRTGYTGEDGWEFFCAAGNGATWLKAILAAGAKPCGLGARDSLRLEMCYPLNGNDLSPTRSPLEAGLGFFVALQKTDFIGAAVLRKQKENGLTSRLVALVSTEKGPPPRAHYPVETKDGSVIGELSSGILSPSLLKGIAMAYLPIDYAKVGTELNVDVRGRKFPFMVVKKPFYKPQRKLS